MQAYYLESVSRQASVRVLSVDFTGAPAANGSHQVEQCLRVYEHVTGALGVPPTRVAWMGEAGGAGLVLSTVLAIAARGLPQPAAACVFSPMASAAPLPSIRENATT